MNVVEQIENENTLMTERNQRAPSKIKQRKKADKRSITAKQNRKNHVDVWNKLKAQHEVFRLGPRLRANIKPVSFM